MKLTKLDKDMIVTRVMQDVPSKDYQEQMRQLVIAWAVKQLPPAVKRIYDDNELRKYVHCHYGPVDGYYFTAPGCWDASGDRAANQTLRLAINDLKAKLAEQTAERRDMRNKVVGVIYPCSTRKQLLDRLPEFEKYLPKEDAPSTNLPAVANVAADLTKAGWPKGKK